MDSIKNIFIKIDEFIFLKLDFLKSDPSFQKILELYSGLEDKQQKLFSQILTFTMISIPYLIVLVFAWGNHNIKKNIFVKSQILEQVSNLSALKESRNIISSTYLASEAIQSQEQLSSKVTGLMSASNIDDSKIHVIAFTPISSTSNITKIEATIRFDSLGIKEFTSLLNVLVEKEKFKILRIRLEKNKTSELLSGDVSLTHLGQNTALSN